MTKRNIAFSPPDITQEEIDEVAAALSSGWITTGPRTKQFEKEINEYTGAEGTVCLASCTAAMELFYRLIGIEEGDEVIVPAYTYTATASAAIHAGATVRFVDSKQDTCQMDLEHLRSLINPKTKVIAAVELAGIPEQHEEIYKIIREKQEMFTPGGVTELGKKLQKCFGRIILLSDSAHAFGMSKKIKSDAGVEEKCMAGNIADFTAFSFHAVKNLTTAEGGALSWKKHPGIDSTELYKWLQLFSLHGQSKDAFAKVSLGNWEYDIVGPFYKANMTDIMAAMGLVQFRRYPKLLTRREELIQKYNECMDSLGIQYLPHLSNEYESSKHLYLIRIPGIDEVKRNELIIKLAEQGIATNVHYKPLPMMTAYKQMGFDIKDFPNAFAYYKNEITLPLHTLITDEDMEYILKCFQEQF